MYIEITESLFYLLVSIDEYSGYIVHHSLLISMDAGLVSLEAKSAIEKIRNDSLAVHGIQSDYGSSFIAMEFKLVSNANKLTEKLVRPIHRNRTHR